MYCSKCGKQIPDDAVICIGCGRGVQPSQNHTQKTTTTVDGAKPLSIVALILSFLAVPIVATVLSIIGLTKYGDTEYRGVFIFTLIFSIIWPIIVFAAIIASISSMIVSLL